MKIGFIGAGNMAQAMVRGLRRNGATSKAEIVLHGGQPANYEKVASELGVRAVESNAAVITESDLIFLAVKPGLLKTIAAEVRNALQLQPKPLVSMLTGVTLADLAQAFAVENLPLVRIMPNVNVAINAGMTALATSEIVTPEQAETVTAVLRAFGRVEPLPEADFSTFVALAGSSPAFVYTFIDALAAAGVKYGLSKSQAIRIAAAALEGSAEMVLTSDKSPRDLADTVASPGGSTIAGMLAMEKAGFTSAVVAAVDATIAADQR